jgi:hypothetical protein
LVTSPKVMLFARPVPVTSYTTPDAPDAVLSGVPESGAGAAAGAWEVGAAAPAPVGVVVFPPLFDTEMMMIRRRTPPTIHGHFRRFFGVGDGADDGADQEPDGGP